MRPGHRVSQLLNIAFDMAAWVGSVLFSQIDHQFDLMPCRKSLARFVMAVPCVYEVNPPETG